MMFGGFLQHTRRCIGGLLVACLAMALPLEAHQSLDTQVVLDFRTDAVRANLRMPLPELLVAEPRLAKSGSSSTPDIDASVLQKYLEDHFQGLTSSRQAWTRRLIDWRVDVPTQSELAPVLEVNLLLLSSTQPVDSIELDISLITHEVPNHQILVLARNTLDRAVAGQAFQLLGALTQSKRRLQVDARVHQPFVAWLDVVRMGGEHIASGFDHLLFLALILLTCCLEQNGKQWLYVRPIQRVLRETMLLITAFTCGHSLTLALGALGMTTVPGVWIESLVALSIVISALHLMRPLPGVRDAWLAACFGLVHGLAFAQALSLMHLTLSDQLSALFGFNLGIELAQLVLVGALLPIYLWALRQAWRSIFRMATASTGVVLGLTWFTQRAFLGLA